MNNPVRFVDLNGESAGEHEYGHLGNLAIAIKFNPNLGDSLNQVLQTIADGASLVGGLVSAGATDIASAIQGEDIFSGRKLSNTDKSIIAVGSLAGGFGDDIVRGAGKLVPGGIKRELAEQIAKGHAWTKHKLKLGEFSDVNTQSGLADRIQDTVQNATSVEEGLNGRMFYGNQDTGTVVITNPHDLDGGTAFTTKNPK